MTTKLRLELTESAVKKIVLENFFSRTLDSDDFEGYFYLDKLGSPIFVVEARE